MGSACYEPCDSSASSKSPSKSVTKAAFKTPTGFDAASRVKMNKRLKKHAEETCAFLTVVSPPLCLQILGSSSKPGGFPPELHEVYHQFALPPLPLHRGLCVAGDAAVWRTVSIGLCVLLCCDFCSSSCSLLLLLLRFNFEGGTPPTNFDTFAAAIMTVFQVRPS